jgi:autotransporter-associated beta strand protein
MRNRTSRRGSRNAMFAAAVALVPGFAAKADTFVWTAATTGGDNSTVTSPLNWTNISSTPVNLTGVPGAGTSLTGGGDIAIFDNIGQSNAAGNFNVGSAISLGSIEFGNASLFYPPANTSPLMLTNNVTVSGSAITLYGTNQAGLPVAMTRDEGNTGVDLINNAIVLENTSSSAAAIQQFNIAGTSGSLTIAGAISQVATGSPNQNSGLEKLGDGTLVLGATNTYAGQTLVFGGTLMENVAPQATTSGNIQLGTNSNPANAMIILSTAATTTQASGIDVRNTGSTSTQLTIGPSATAGVTYNGDVNLYNNVQLSGNLANSNQIIFSGDIQTGPSGVLSSNVTKVGNGWVAPTGHSTYYGTTTVSNGILAVGTASGANVAGTTAATYTAGSTTLQLSSVAGLTVGQAVAGPGVPISVTVNTGSSPVAPADLDTITAINTTTNTVTLSRAIDPTFTSTAPVGTTIYFGTSNPLGLSTSSILVGDSNTTLNNSSPVLFTTTVAIARPITVTNNPTSGVDYLGSRQSGGSFTGLVTLDNPATIAIAASDTVTFSGGIVSGNGPQTLTFGSTTALATVLGSFGTGFTTTNGTVTVSNAIADGAGQIQVLVNAGTISFTVPMTFSGNTTINGGTVALSATGAITNSPKIDMNGGAISIAAADNLTIGPSQTLLGQGTITGVATGTVIVNGTLQTGQTNNTVGKTASTLTLPLNSVLGGTVQEDLTAVNTSDEVLFSGTGTVTVGGTITVTNPNSIPLASGQSYQLLGYGTNVPSGNFGIVNLPTLPVTTPTIGWNTSKLSSAGAITIGSSLIWNNSNLSNPPVGDGVSWDNTNQNWNNGSGVTTYSDGNIVNFTDSNNMNYAVSISSTVLPGAVNVTTANTYTFSGSGIGGNAILTKSGVGTLLLNNSGNAFGTVTVNQGTLTTTNSGEFGSATVTINPTGTSGTSADAATLNSTGSFNSQNALIVNTNSATAIGTVNMLGSTETIGSLAGSGTVVLANTGGTALTVGANNLSTTFNGTVSDNSTGLGSLTHVGTGTLTLGGTNTYGGGTTLNGGTLVAGSAGALGTTGTILFGTTGGVGGTLIGGGGTLASSALNQTDYSSRFSTASGQNISINTNGQNIAFGSTVNSLGGTLTKFGAGTLTISQVPDSGTGGIIVNGGTLTSTVAGAFNVPTFIASTNNSSSAASQAPETTNPVTSVVINSTNSFGSSTNLFVDGVGANTVTVNLNGTTEILGSLGNTSTGGGSAKVVLNNPAGTILTFGNNLNTTIGSLITDNGTNKGGLVYVGTGTLSLLTAGTYGGGFTQEAGVVDSNRAGVLGTGPTTVNPIGPGPAILVDSAAFTVANAVTVNSLSDTAFGRLTLEAASTTIGSLAGNGGNIALALNAAQTLTMGGNNTTTAFNGSISDEGGSKAALVFNGTGTCTLSGENNYGAGTTVSKGTLDFGNTDAFPTESGAPTNLTIAANAVAGATDHGANPVTVLQINTLTNNGKIDLTNNAMSVQSGSLSTIVTQVTNGYSHGTWAGTSGITSSTAANDSTHTTGVGVILNNDGNGNQIYGGSVSFDGTSPALNDVLVKYTYYGDTNLDGHVDANDYIAIDNGFTMGLSGWNNGDFNYDSVVNGDDYTLMDNAFNTQTAAGFAVASAGPAEIIASNTAQIAGGATSVSAVPEPTTFGLIGIGAIGLLNRRRRRS